MTHATRVNSIRDPKQLHPIPNPNWSEEIIIPLLMWVANDDDNSRTFLAAAAVRAAKQTTRNARAARCDSEWVCECRVRYAMIDRERDGKKIVPVATR